ncbi:RNA pseudouridylate synthase domain-containing protein 2 [Hypsibius exemplaris]|uniref:Pseudouridine synthase n=1 Tax=Hypsibius exemplaris TaxID=2072580 RepID=A0A1W0WA91_HYPEX|nr:RNA pseudouridylate synthase domain-containing protein 2 [Hypsibius exemplaris]
MAQISSAAREILLEEKDEPVGVAAVGLPKSIPMSESEVTTQPAISLQRKRPHGPDLSVPERKKKPPASDVTIDLTTLPDTKYYFENGLRKVEPYHFTWTTYAKGRWVGRMIEEVFLEEFFSVNEEVTKARVHADPCNVFVNGIRSNVQHKIKNSDYIAHYMHRHEMPVTAEPIKIIAETDDMLVVDKPASIPVHPCGRFRMNSVTFILAVEFGRTGLRIAHRLDRLTSGLLIFTKNIAASQGIHVQMEDRSVRKEYIARVAGEFPAEQIVCSEPIDCVNIRAGVYQVRASGKHSVTSFDRLSFDPESNTSIVHCKPRTGRTHQIRVHLQHIGYPIVNDPFYGAKSTFTGKDAAVEYGKDDALGPAFADECQKQLFTKCTTLPDRPWIDPKCPECWLDFADPKPEDMRIDLHAWKYEGPGWKFATELPFWAKDVTVLPARTNPPPSW